MLGGPSLFFQKSNLTRKHGANQPGPPPQPQHDGSCLGFSGDHQPEWWHEILYHIKAADQNARHVLQKAMQRRHLGRKQSGDMAIKYSSLCFASISSSLNRDNPEQVKIEDLKDSAEQLGEDLRVPVPEAKVPGVGDVRSLALKQLLCGIIAGAVASFAVSPFQVLRTRVIAGRGGSSAAEVLGTVAHAEGMEALMKGSLKFTLMATSLQKGIQFAVYEAVKRKEEEKMGRDPRWLPGVSRKVPISKVAGATAGLVSTFVVYPFNHLMDRLLLQPSEYSSIWGSAAKVMKESGIAELYRGFVPAVITMVPQAAASFYTYETVKNYLNERAEPERGGGENYLGMSAVSIGAGAAAGLVATALTYPLEVARKQISMSVLPHGTVGIGGGLTYNSLPQALVGIAQREGLGGFYRGFAVQALQVIPMTAISFAVYEIAKRGFVAQHEERRDEVKG